VPVLGTGAAHIREGAASAPLREDLIPGGFYQREPPSRIENRSRFRESCVPYQLARPTWVHDARSFRLFHETSFVVGVRSTPRSCPFEPAREPIQPRKAYGFVPSTGIVSG